MLPDEIMKLIQEAADPDKAPNALMEIQTKFEDLTNAVNISNRERDELAARVQNLTDTNQRLFLRVTGATVPPDQDDEQKQVRDMSSEERESYFRDLINKEE